MFSANSRFLVVDDSKVSRDLVRVGLQSLSLRNLDEAVNGKDGWDKILKSVESQNPYALIFCDINMPEIDGLKLLEMIRNNPKTATQPVLIITTEGEKQMVIKAVMSGVSGYMVKPFGIEDVKNKVQELYGRLSTEYRGSAV